ncbi:hypothetical protein [Frateuria soli]|uniref:hypothetical protein n=1 Tax=Frateuria soli TaxID=1542730 RepID=UPI001E53DA67|nr:hypothetical protein [Frateuria soli]UGB39527.1 hypothetical protein LQ771_06780 [Frateuria soli]
MADERRLATLSAWREPPRFSERERAPREWIEPVTRVSQEQLPDSAWSSVCGRFSLE